MCLVNAYTHWTFYVPSDAFALGSLSERKASGLKILGICIWFQPSETLNLNIVSALCLWNSVGKKQIAALQIDSSLRIL